MWSIYQRFTPSYFECDMSGAEFILPGERKSHHELEQSVPATSQGLGKTDESRSE